MERLYKKLIGFTMLALITQTTWTIVDVYPMYDYKYDKDYTGQSNEQSAYFRYQDPEFSMTEHTYSVETPKRLHYYPDKKEHANDINYYKK